MLDDGGAAIHPVAAVDVGQTVHLADGGAVDVPADDAVETALAYRMDHRVLEIVNEIDRPLDAAFGVAGQRPVAGNAQGAPQPGKPGIDAHQEVVGDVAQHRHPAVMTHHLIEFVAVQQQVAAAIGRGVDVLADHADVAERGVDVLAQGFVMVAGNQHHLIPAPRPSQHFLHHGVLLRRPVDRSAHRPEIDDIPDQKEMVGFVLAQKIDESSRLAAARSEMDIGEKYGTEPQEVNTP